MGIEEISGMFTYQEYQNPTVFLPKSIMKDKISAALKDLGIKGVDFWFCENYFCPGNIWLEISSKYDYHSNIKPTLSKVLDKGGWHIISTAPYLDTIMLICNPKHLY